ncbi:MAG TPA: hypothetical protein VK859_03520, partial [bacterium]|nr:hypothetical protein [bacterium]
MAPVLWVRSQRTWRLGGGIGFLFSLLLAFGFAQEKAPAAKSFLPDLVLCGKKHNSLFHIRHGKMDWDEAFDGPLKDVQPQPQ